MWCRVGEAMARVGLPGWQAIDALRDSVVIQGQDSLGKRKGDEKGCRVNGWAGRWSVALSLSHDAGLIHGVCLLCDVRW